MIGAKEVEEFYQTNPFAGESEGDPEKILEAVKNMSQDGLNAEEIIPYGLEKMTEIGIPLLAFAHEMSAGNMEKALRDVFVTLWMSGIRCGFWLGRAEEAEQRSSD